MPRAPERALVRALAPMAREIRATLPKIRTPADAVALGRALRRRWPDSRIQALFASAGGDVEQASARAWRRGRTDAGRCVILDAAKPKAYDGAALVDAWSREAAAKITSVRDEVAEALRAEIVEALRVGTDPKGLSARWIAKGIPVQFGTLEGRSKVIAQHQLSTLNARVQKTRAGAVGVRQFWWRDQGDQDVRDLHQELSSGGPYSYKDPQTQGEGLPGEPVGCRCWAESVVPAEIDLGVVFA